MRSRGCDGKSDPLPGFDFDPSLKRCPWASYPPEAFAVMAMHQRATGRLRSMPFGGAFEDQPLWVGQAFDIIEQERARAQDREAEKHRAEVKAAQKRRTR